MLADSPSVEKLNKNRFNVIILRAGYLTRENDISDFRIGSIILEDGTERAIDQRGHDLTLIKINNIAIPF